MNRSDSETAKAYQVPILVVDSDRQVLQVLHVLKQVEENCGYCVRYSSDISNVLNSSVLSQTDVLFLDISVRHTQGLQVLSKIRNIRQEIIIVMISANADVPMARDALNNGADDFLAKPLSPLGLVISIERNLRRREMEAKRIIQQRNKVLLETIKALSAAMDAKEHGTARHSERMIATAMLISDALGLSAVERSTLELAAYMHDIGKIGIRESILLKPDKLSEAEWREMKMHPDLGCHILSNIEELSDLTEIIRHHHERVDGAGYPGGLAGEQIPLLSRILAVADAYDAMTSDRPYRRLLSEQEALIQLKAGSDTQFDSRIVDVFINSLNNQSDHSADI